MTIENLTLHYKNTANLSQNNVNNIHNKNILNTNNSSIGSKKDNEIPHSNNVNKTITPEMKRLIQKLDLSEKSEMDTQTGMSFLNQKKTCLNTIDTIGCKLKELSKQYTDSSSTEEDKNKIEEQAEKLLNHLDKLMNSNISENDSTIDCKTIPIQDTTGKTSILLSKPIYITLEATESNSNNMNNKSEKDSSNNDHFKNKLSTKSLLENASIIDEKILNPIQKAIEDVDKDKSQLYHTFLDAHSSATSTINRLFELGNMSLFKRNSNLKFQQSLYDSVSSLRFQSSNIDKDNALSFLL
jgi:BMFP domain-containing protein YqiC